MTETRSNLGLWARDQGWVQGLGWGWALGLPLACQGG